MKYLSRRTFPHAAPLVAACALLALAASGTARAQAIPPTEPSQQDAFNRRDMRDRESALRIRAAAESKKVSRLDPERLLAEIEEDFARIQALNNQMRRAAPPAGPADYKRLASAGADMRKRAARLKENLAFPEPEAEAAAERKDAAPPDAERVRAALTSLDESIVRFVNNPVFQSISVNAPQAAEAARDLRRIIELSDEIRRAAERLHKSRAKSQ